MTTITLDKNLNAFGKMLEFRNAQSDKGDPLYTLKQRGWRRFVELGGLPHTKQKGFEYFPLRKLYNCDFELSNGQIAYLCDDPSVVILPFREAMQTYGGFLEHRMRQLIHEEVDPFALLNIAHFNQAFFVYVPPGKTVTTPLVFSYPEYLSGFFSPRIHFFLGKGAQLQVSMDYHSSLDTTFVNEAIDITLEEGAQLTVTKQVSAPWHLRSLRSTQKRDSLLKSMHTTIGGLGVRDAYNILLDGENCDANLYGLWNLRDNNQAHTHVLVEHKAENCRSRQHFKGVLDDCSRSSFVGKIYVHKEAQKTDAFQMNNNLILGKKAHADSQPNLEIFADDVKASHGATVGQLEPENLFYLETRGIAENEAKKLLVEAFCDEITQQFS